jgi:hypothetical protein
MQIERSDRQEEKAFRPRVKSLEWDSNAKFERLLQSVKQNGEIVSIDEGIQTECNDVQEVNAYGPRFESLEPDSNLKSER